MRDQQISAPIMPHGAVVVNACFDHAHSACLDDSTAKRSEFHYVAKHELVFRDKKTNKRKRGAYNEPTLRVFASANGVKRETLGNVSFIGASNGTLAEGAHSHSAVTIAGLTTIRNTGTSVIEAGDTVAWDVNDEKDPHNKCRKVFSTVPYRDAFEGDAQTHFEAVADAVTDIPSVAVASVPKNDSEKCAKMIAQIGDDKLKDALISAFSVQDEEFRDFLKCYVACTRAVDSRVIGTAMTKASEGQDFDILLRHSH